MGVEARLRSRSAIARIVGACGFLLLTPFVASAQNNAVAGRANPNLAGRANGYTCCSGDSMPEEQPYDIQDVEIEPCSILHFTVTGRVSYEPGNPVGNNPDGDNAYSMINYGDGISAPLGIRDNALVGVFLGDDSPTGKTTPSQLDFGGELGFAALAPGVRQIFFVGDGRTADSKIATAGDLQDFVVPWGATRLFLGTSDGLGWFNNSGNFSVTASATPYVAPFPCGDAVGPDQVAASDALRILKVAVGSAECTPCLCDVDHSGAIVSNDALRVLRYAVGQPVALECPCCFDIF